MADKPTTFDFGTMFDCLKEKIALSGDIDSQSYIPDIIEFCNAKQYLNFAGQGISLYPMQQIILRCVSGDNYVIDGDSHEKITVRDFCKDQRKTILSLDEKRQLVPGKVLWSGHTGKKKIIQIALRRTKRCLSVTLDHRILTHRGYIIAENLRDDDMIVIPRTLPSKQNKADIPDHEIKLLAYFIGDGSCSHYPHFVSADHEPEIRDDFISAVRFFDPSLRCDLRQQNGCAIIKVVKNCSNKRNPHVENSLWKFLEKYGLAGKTAHHKRIPSIIYQMSLDQISLFMSRLFCTDGHASVLKCHGEESHAVVGYSTCNRLLAEDVQHMLLRYDIISDIISFQVPYEYKVVKTLKDQYQVIIRRAQDIIRFSDYIGMFGKEEKLKNCVRFSSSVSSYSPFDELPDNIRSRLRNIFKSERKSKFDYNREDQIKFNRLYKNKNYNRRYAQYVADLTDNSYAQSIVDSHITYDRIEYITQLGDEDVYDISVEKHHNFLCNDIVVHNCFYRGQIGNEHVRLTDDELKLIKKNKMNQVIDKYQSNSLFRDLVLVLGRRSGKDFLTSLIALYEAMKLLEIPGGCPYKYYNIAPGNPIYILTVATSSDQAKVLFREITAKLALSDYFRNKIGHSDADRIWLLTPEDRKRNKELEDKGLEKSITKGSIVIMSGHSNSDSLLGKGYFCLLFDEVASFKTTGSSSSGERLYSALGPGQAAFNKPVFINPDGTHTISPVNRNTAKKLLDVNGDQVRQLDAKIISISSPRGEEGQFFKLYTAAAETDYRLAFRLPTWKVNLSITEASCRNDNKYMSINEFQMEFGAEFSGTAGEKFIANQYVDAAIHLGTQLGVDQKIAGIPGMIYYAHLDPAATSHNYALTVMHMEVRVQVRETETGKRIKEQVRIFVIDHLKVWHPTPGRAINVYEVDEYVIDLAKRFRFAMVSYDSFSSLASIQKLRRVGIPTKMTPFRKQYKMQIFNQLEHLLVNNQLALPYKGPHYEQLERELKCLKRIYSYTGFKIEADPEGAITTDDMADSIAGAIGVAMESTYTGYAKGTTVAMPQFRDQTPTWNIGSGSYTSGQWGVYDKRFGMPRQ